MRLPNIILVAALLAFSCAMSAQVIPGLGGVAGPTSSIIGQIQTATGGTINNGALTFTLSQSAVVSGSASIVTQQSACYTSTAGNIVGIPDPVALPILSVNTATGTLPAGAYFVKIHYVSTSGLSVVSPEASVVLSSQGTVIVSPPLIQPSQATGYGVSISSTSQTETIQGVVTGWSSFSKSTPLLAGSAPPAVNSSNCNVYFSDQLVPTGTYYTVNLLNKNGSQVAGFPQTWCTYGGAGATINVSQGAPTGNCNTTGVFYPTPVFANPPGGNQSLAGNFSLTGNLTVGGIFSPTQLKIGGDTTISAAPRMIVSCFKQAAATVGGNTGDCFFAPDKAITITRVIFGNTLTPPAGCTTQPHYGVILQAGLVTVADTGPLANGAMLVDSGVVAVNLTAGATYIIGQTGGDGGCGTHAGPGNITVQYKMQ